VTEFVRCTPNQDFLYLIHLVPNIRCMIHSTNFLCNSARVFDVTSGIQATLKKQKRPELSLAVRIM